MLWIIDKNAPQFTLVSLSPVGSDSVLEMKIRAPVALDELKELLAKTEQCAAQALIAKQQAQKYAQHYRANAVVLEPRNISRKRNRLRPIYVYRDERLSGN
jgi:hypothetical protein